MNLSLSRLMHRAPLPATRVRRPAPTLPPPAAGGDDDPPGCGWFDSSHALQAGLQVHEHANADTLAQLMPLAAWIELQLASCCAARPA